MAIRPASAVPVPQLQAPFCQLQHLIGKATGMSSSWEVLAFKTKQKTVGTKKNIPCVGILPILTSARELWSQGFIQKEMCTSLNQSFLLSKRVSKGGHVATLGRLRIWWSRTVQLSRR